MASSSLAAANHPHLHFLPSKPICSSKPITRARPLSLVLLTGAGACAASRRASSSSQAELRPDSKNAPALSRELRRLARVGRLPSALALLDHLSHRGVPATASTFAALLSACRSLTHARQVRARLRVHGSESNDFLLARFVELYLALGAGEDARQVLDGLPRASSFSWNALLHGQVRRERGQAGGAMADGFAEMHAAGADANEYTEKQINTRFLVLAVGMRLHTKLKCTYSCLLPKIFARNTAKIGLSLIHPFKKASHLLMGCLCSKGTKDDADATSENKTPLRNSAAVSVKAATSTNNGDSDVIDGQLKENASILQSGNGEKVIIDLDVRISSGNNSELKGLSGEHAAAGWPAWLANVAPKAVEGWLPQRADSFEKLDKIGQGTYSIVYKARDLKTGKIVVLKKVRFVNMDPESVRFMAREIHILRTLDHPNVIKLQGIVTSHVSQSLYLVFEYMEHDLSGLISTPGLKLTEPQIKCFVQQLLHGLEHCHKNGVLHRDIKGSNLLIDGNGMLKIADFGLAISYDPKNPQPLTSRVVTLWYRPPELLLGATEYGVSVDMWSTGCIVAELFAGKPIMPGRTEVEQIHKIFKLCGSPMDDYCKKSKVPETAMFKPQHQYRRCVAETFKVFPTSAVVLIDSLLSLDPEARGTAASALQSDFFRKEPFACDPPSLPKLPPSKEYDVRLRQEEARRQKNAALGGLGAELVRLGNENRVTNRAIGGAGELQQQTHTSSKSNSDKFNPEESVPGFRVETRARPTTVQLSGYSSAWNNMEGNNDQPTVPGRACSSVRVPNACSIRKKGSSHSLIPQFGATDLRSTVDAADHSHPPDRHGGNKNPEVKDAMNHGRKYRRIHHSGPLMPPGGNVEDMLEEHERHIQEAVRKARVGKPGR